MNNLPLTIKPKKIDGLYEVYNKDFGYLYNPKGYGGIVVLDSDSIRLLDKFDGEKTLEELLKENKKGYAEMNSAIQYLTKLDIVEAEKSTKKVFEPSVDCWLHTTNSCNLACSYCYIHKCKGDMPIGIAKTTINKLVEYAQKINAKTIYLRLAGGEPLLRETFLANIIEYANSIKGDLNIVYILISNGTLINDNYIKFIKENNIKLGISLDGIEKYNVNRSYPDGKNSYENVMDSIDLLLKNNIKPRILVTVCPANLDGLPNLTSHLIKKGLSFRFSLERNMDTGYPQILDKIDETIAVLSNCIEIMKDEVTRGNADFSFQLGDVTFTHPKSRVCGIGSNTIAVSHTGDVGTCGMDLINTFANVTKDSVFENLHSSYSDLLQTHSYNINGCKNCVWRYSCANACPKQTFATYGKYDVVSPYCKIYKHLIPKVIDLLAYQIWQKSNNL